ncbi:VOC family protein [Sorangium sp. So ce1078]|uniref:VOC family protein n=1 Tax=Sorangium sp. So ce1078 TaxID=3133329 RepID=UPI003F633641
MLSDQPIIAFLATRDPARAKEYYRDVLGLRFVADEEAALVFEAHQTMLRIQKVHELTPHPFTAFGWKVPDVKAAIAELSRRGVRFERYGFLEQDGDGIWRAPGGVEIAWFKDPDGNLLSLTKF